MLAALVPPSAASGTLLAALTKFPFRLNFSRADSFLFSVRHPAEQSDLSRDRDFYWGCSAFDSGGTFMG